MFHSQKNLAEMPQLRVIGIKVATRLEATLPGSPAQRGLPDFSSVPHKIDFLHWSP